MQPSDSPVSCCFPTSPFAWHGFIHLRHLYRTLNASSISLPPFSTHPTTAPNAFCHCGFGLCRDHWAFSALLLTFFTLRLLPFLSVPLTPRAARSLVFLQRFCATNRDLFFGVPLSVWLLLLTCRLKRVPFTRHGHGGKEKGAGGTLYIAFCWRAGALPNGWRSWGIRTNGQTGIALYPPLYTFFSFAQRALRRLFSPFNAGRWTPLAMYPQNVVSGVRTAHPFPPRQRSGTRRWHFLLPFLAPFAHFSPFHSLFSTSSLPAASTYLAALLTRAPLPPLPAIPFLHAPSYLLTPPLRLPSMMPPSIADQVHARAGRDCWKTGRKGRKDPAPMLFLCTYEQWDD